MKRDIYGCAYCARIKGTFVLIELSSMGRYVTRPLAQEHNSNNSFFYRSAFDKLSQYSMMASDQQGRLIRKGDRGGVQRDAGCRGNESAGIRT